MQNQKFLPATYDFVFKYVFGSEPNTDILKEFLSAHLKFQADDELEEITVKNPFFLKTYQEDKFGILDIKCHTKHHRVIDVEIQVRLVDFLAYRIEFYEASMIREQIGIGDSYAKLHPVITLLILNENWYNDGIYHHCFYNFDPVAKIKFSDLKEIHVLELNKLTHLTKDSLEYKWGQLLTTDKEDEMDAIAQYGPVFAKAVESIKSCSEDEYLRELAISRERWELDQRTRDVLAKQREERIAQAEKRIAQTKQDIAQTKQDIAQTKQDIVQTKQDIVQIEKRIAQKEQQAKAELHLAQEALASKDEEIARLQALLSAKE